MQVFEDRCEASIETTEGSFVGEYDEIMSDDQINEAYLFYSNLSDKTGAHFQIYTECTSTHEARFSNETPFGRFYGRFASILEHLRSFLTTAFSQ